MGVGGGLECCDRAKLNSYKLFELVGSIVGIPAFTYFRIGKELGNCAH